MQAEWCEAFGTWETAPSDVLPPENPFTKVYPNRTGDQASKCLKDCVCGGICVLSHHTLLNCAAKAPSTPCCHQGFISSLSFLGSSLGANCHFCIPGVLKSSGKSWLCVNPGSTRVWTAALYQTYSAGPQGPSML